jgi:hypothetical protein
MNKARLVIVLGTLLLCAACGGGEATSSGPTQEQAGALLDDFFALAQDHDGQAFCADDRVFSAPMCQRHWDVAGGPEAVPSAPPKVLEARPDDDLIALRVCGTDGLGRAYLADFVVEEQGDSLKVPLPVFWGGRTFSGTYEESKEPPAEAAASPAPPAGCRPE